MPNSASVGTCSCLKIVESLIIIKEVSPEDIPAGFPASSFFFISLRKASTYDRGWSSLLNDCSVIRIACEEWSSFEREINSHRWPFRSICQISPALCGFACWRESRAFEWKGIVPWTWILDRLPLEAPEQRKISIFWKYDDILYFLLKLSELGNYLIIEFLLNAERNVPYDVSYCFLENNLLS